MISDKPDLTFRIIEHLSDEYWESVRLRHDILRQPLHLEFDPKQLFDEADSLHLICRYRDSLAGCLILKPLTTQTCQMRQVCVRNNLQYMGIGKALVSKSEELAIQKGFTEIIMHARCYAVPFYEKLGYQKYDEQYILLGINHWNLKKKLT